MNIRFNKMTNIIENMLLLFLQELKMDNPDIADLIDTCEYEYAIERIIELAVSDVNEHIDHNYD